VAAHFPSTLTASLSPGHGGMVTATAVNGYSFGDLSGRQRKMIRHEGIPFAEVRETLGRVTSLETRMFQVMIRS
jgi:hypothetical protein